MKRERLTMDSSNIKKKNQELPQTAICQQTGKYRKKRYVNTQSTKIES